MEYIRFSHLTHNLLLSFILLYLLISVAIGIYSSLHIKNKSDFINAGKRLPLTFVMAMVFATWFGSEALLGIPAEFIKEGFAGIIKDPFGAFFCLSIVGFLLAKRWYNMNVATLGNIYEKRFGTKVEVLISICIVISYFGWISAQLVALGFVINILSLNLISISDGIVLGAAVVLTYTITGGMLSIALNDFIQFIVIVISVIYIVFTLSKLSGGFSNVVSLAYSENMFTIIKNYDAKSFLQFFGALFTMMLGSLPQQDIFQRVNSAKNSKTAQLGVLSGAWVYLIFCLLPIFLVFAAKIIDPLLVEKWINEDSQMILPSIILNYTPLVVQVLFFGALLSAIMSTASGTLIAPSVTITENLIKKIYPTLSDKKYILVLRSTILITGLSVTLFALKSNATIYDMVGNAYKITLVTSVAPLFAAMFWKRATTKGALSSIIMGFIVWITGEIMGISEPQFFGFLASVFAIIIVSYLTKKQSDEIIDSVVNYNMSNK